MNYRGRLTEMLKDIARRSFYEDVIISRDERDSYVIEDDYNALVEDATWTYEGGIVVPGATGHSGLMETYEFFSTAAQIEYHVPGAVAALGRGDSVSFSYVAVRDDSIIWNEASDTYLDNDGDIVDDVIVGWTLAYVVYPRS